MCTFHYGVQCVYITNVEFEALAEIAYQGTVVGVEKIYLNWVVPSNAMIIWVCFFEAVWNRNIILKWYFLWCLILSRCSKHSTEIIQTNIHVVRKWSLSSIIARELCVQLYALNQLPVMIQRRCPHNYWLWTEGNWQLLLCTVWITAKEKTNEREHNDTNDANETNEDSNEQEMHTDTITNFLIHTNTITNFWINVNNNKKVRK